ncbi:MAG: SH3 domain-containing protein [Anaerolineae bacterium]|nr:SH3 domain-containing protein [Anaerolineae bacterium]MDQ7035022.1 SH3 domain-containing protein [Anaerolineae bacterium]
MIRTQKPYSSIFLPILWLLIVAACTAQDDPAVVVELDNPPTPTAIVIYVTPTTAPTAISTVALSSPEPTETSTPEPTNTPDLSQVFAQCEADLAYLYTQASDACLGEPNGYFCNGGLAPDAEPVGAISNQMAVIGSLVEVSLVERINPPPISFDNSGGVLWLRLAEPQNISALIVGDVNVTDITPTDSNFAAWQSIQVETRQHATNCSAPRSTIIIQSPYGDLGQIVVNGVSLEINGTIAIATDGTETEFIALEGRTQLLIFGESRIIQAGEQINITYQAGDFTRPVIIPDAAQPLNFIHVRDMPITLLDRPVLLPQPGLVYTDGRVNMRAEPTVNSRLLYQVPNNQPLSVLGENTEGTWLHVRLGNGETGWMRADLVTGTVDEITVAYDATPEPPQRFGTNVNGAVVVAAAGGNLRNAPDVQFNVIDTIEAGTEVSLLSRSPYSPWVKVDTGTQVGWMALITLETNAVVSFLPIDYGVPNPPGPTATPILTFGGGHAYPDPRGGQ